VDVEDRGLIVVDVIPRRGPKTNIVDVVGIKDW
jgi:hypothetical protein